MWETEQGAGGHSAKETLQSAQGNVRTEMSLGWARDTGAQGLWGHHGFAQMFQAIAE